MQIGFCDQNKAWLGFEAYFVRSSFSPGNKFPVEACIKNPALAVLKVCEGNKHVLALQT